MSGVNYNSTSNLPLTSAGSNTLQTKTTTYTATNDDDIILCDTSGGGWTLTLPPGSSGKVFKIVKTSTDVLVLTIDGDSSENIREGGASATTTTLNTKGEAIEIAWDGTRWEVISRRTSTVWTSFTVTASLTNITYTGFWRRNGDTMEIQIDGLVGAGGPSSGTMTFTIPLSLSIDTAKITTNAGIATFGYAYCRDSGTADYTGVVTENSGSATTVIVHTNGNSDSWTDTRPIGFVLNDFFSLNFKVPISGWKG